MTLSSRALNVLVILMTTVAVGAVGVRAWSAWSGAESAIVSDRKDWREYAAEGMIVGDSAAKVTITVFSDFQCPYCRTLADSVAALMPRYQGRVRMVFRNRPLASLHVHAESAALWAICANRQGRFAEFHDALFRDQENIGKRDWIEFGVEAQIADTAKFRLCRDEPSTMDHLQRDIEASKRLKLTGTPLLLVNETMVRGLPPGRQLDSLVQRAVRSVGEGR